MKARLAVLITAALVAAPAAQAATPQTIAKRGAMAKAKAISKVASARVLEIRLVGPGKRYEVGVRSGTCTVVMYVTVVRQRARKVQVTMQDCG